MSNAQFLAALNGTLTNTAALAGEMPENLRDALKLGDADLATSGVSTLMGVDGSGGLVNTPAKVIDLRDYGLSTSASAATNTAAFAEALTAAQTARVGLFVAEGDYPCDSTTIARTTQNTQVSIFANPGGRARFIKDSADGQGLFQLSTATPSGYMALQRFSNIVFQGFAGDSPFSLRGYDLARCLFDNCQFNGALTGLDLKGGIGNSFFACTMDGNAIGVSAKKYTGGYDGWPNLNSFTECRIINNTSWGVDFNDGLLLALKTCDVEGNGTNGDANTGGVSVGNAIGSKDGITAPGLVATDGCWFEGNSGNAAVRWESGQNTVRDSFFVGNANATYDSRSIGGNYNISNCVYSNNKTNNHYDDATVASGNYFRENYHLGGITIDAAKTMLQDLTVITTPSVRATTTAGIKVRDSANRVIINAFTSGTPDSWLEQSGFAGGAGIGVGSSIGGGAGPSDVWVTPLGTGLAKITNPRIVSKAAPASAAATGTQGEVRWDTSFVYICTATDTWKRVAIATW
jgi:hypothetical protein